MVATSTGREHRPVELFPVWPLVFCCEAGFAWCGCPPASAGWRRGQPNYVCAPAYPAAQTSAKLEQNRGYRWSLPPAFLFWSPRTICIEWCRTHNAHACVGGLYVVHILIWRYLMFGHILVILSAMVIVAVMSIYFPTVYIRKTNVMIGLLEKIEANTRK